MGEFTQEAAGAPRDSSGAPQPGLESAVARIWCEVLEVADVGVDQGFFELGGDSLKAVRMLSALADVTNAEVDFVDFLDGPTVAALAIAVKRSREQPAAGSAGVSPTPDGGVPATFAQERLWFLQQLEGSTDAYNVPTGLRIRGPLDPGAIERALREIVRRHSALRTTFVSVGGEARQVVAPEGSLSTLLFELVDLRAAADPEAEAQRLVAELTMTPFELERGPLMRAALLRVADEDHIIEIVCHHIICDGWSQVLVLRELGVLYNTYARGESASLPAPRVQYPDYAIRQRTRFQGPALKQAVAPWVQRLAGAPVSLDIPTDRPRPQIPSYRGATHRMRLSDDVVKAVGRFAREAGVTTFATLLAAYLVLLQRHSGQDDVVVGATTSGRDSADSQDAIGLFASTVALRGDLTGQPSFRELVERTRDTVLWAIAHEAAPFEQIVARLQLERDLSRHPIFQVFCAHVPLAASQIDGAEPYDAQPLTSRFDLTLFIEEEPDEQLDLAWEYSSDLFDGSTIERFGREYARLLEAAMADPDRRVGELPMRDAADRLELTAVEVGADAEYPVACMHDLFARRVAETPEAVALISDASSLTYGELNARANQIAHHLRALGAGPETLVALFLEPSLELVTAILGVLKSGAAYVPLDPEYPSERVGFVLGDAAAPLLVTREALLERLPAHDATVLCLDRDAPALAAESSSDPDPLAGPDNLAYVIYTSGSTGHPKGVQVEHRQVARLFSATDAWYGFGPSDVWVLLHSYAFDFSVWELWGALAYGGRLVISPIWTTRSPEALASLVAGQGVTVLNATPSLFAAIQDELLRVADELSLRFVIFGGEALAPATLRPWFRRFGDGPPTLVNMYGITETTVHVTYRPLSAADAERERSPIGVPIPDLSLYLLDPGRAPVPTGVAGELYVGGAGVARGYLNRPELTADRFLANPFAPGRLYRTGDVARRLDDGELEFRGRIDDQVKIRGYRIELGEIQAAMLEVDGVADGAVIAVEAARGGLRLAAYAVPDNGAAAALAESLRDAIWAHFEAKLPSFMVPASLVLLDALPLTRNGKTDRKALPPTTWDKDAADGFLAPQTPTESAIAEIWQAVLGVEKVGSADNFFNLGGHSLLAARVVTQVRERFAGTLSVRALFEQPELSRFANYVDAAQLADAEPPPAATPAPEARVDESDEAIPLSFQQQQMLFLQELAPGSVAYNGAHAVRVQGDLDRDLLQKALVSLHQRHQAMRTVLAWDETSQRQVILEDPTVELPLIDLSHLPEDERGERLELGLREHARRAFDLAADLTLRTTLFRVGAAEHVILFHVHHVGWDAWSIEILYRDLSELYAAAQEGRDAVLPELPRQYGDFAVYQRQRLRGELLERELDFWRTRLAGAPTLLELPTDRPRQPIQTFAGATHNVRLGGELADSLREICQAQQVTPYVMLLATFATLLYRRTGQDDILFGGPMANRDHHDYKDVIGFVANTIVVRAGLGGNPRFSELLAGIRTSVLESYEHQEVPLEVVVDAVRPRRHPGANPLFQVNFRVRVGGLPAPEFGDAVTSPIPVDLGLARFDLALELHVLRDGIAAEFIFNTELFERATIERLAQDFENLLAQALREPSTRLLSFRLAAGRDGEVEAAQARPTGSIRRFRNSSRQ